MSPAPPSSADPGRQRLDVRSLSLAQLQKLAAQGSRRARAELEGRMRASGTSAPPAAPAGPAPDAAIPTLSSRAARVPDMDEVRAAQARVPTMPPSAARAAGAPNHHLADQLALIARQDEQRARADGPPRLVGLVLIAWGVLMLMGALVMLAYRGGPYYLFCALGVAAVGWLLMRRSRWAMALHGALLLVALGWAWYGARGSLATALVQAAPLLIPAAWMAVRPVREPLE